MRHMYAELHRAWRCMYAELHRLGQLKLVSSQYFDCQTDNFQYDLLFKNHFELSVRHQATSQQHRQNIIPWNWIHMQVKAAVFSFSIGYLSAILLADYLLYMRRAYSGIVIINCEWIRD